MPLAPKLIFAVSFLAMRTEESIIPSSDKETVRTLHTPALFIADSLEGVETMARDLAFSSWPSEEGWSTRSASIRQISVPFLFDLNAKGLIVDGMNVNHGTFINFDDPFADL